MQKLVRNASLLLILSLFLFACTSQNKTKEQLLAEGIQEVQKNKPGVAIVLFKKSLEKDQNYFEARLQLAKAYNLTGNGAAAEKELQKVQRQNPSSREVRTEMARALLLGNRPDDALRELSSQLGVAAPDCDTLQTAGWAYSLKENYDAGISLLKKAVDTCGQENMTPRLYLAASYASKGSMEEAENQVNQILAKDASNRKALYLLSDLQMKRKDRASAIKTYDRLIAANPNDIEAQYRKGLLFIDNGEYDNANALSGSMIKKFSSQPEGYRLQGFALFFKKQYNDALAPLQKSLQQQPNAGTYFILGLTHYYRNERQQAINQYQKALDLQPSMTRARVQLAQVLLLDSRTDDAIKEAKKAIADDDKNALGHSVLGSAYLTKGNYADGIAELNKALQIDPSLSEVHLKKGFAAMKRGLDQQAETELAAAVRIRPDAQEARKLLALYYFNHNQPAKGVDLLLKGIHGTAADAASYSLIAESYLRQQNLKESEAYFTKAKQADPKYDLAYQRLAAIYVAQHKTEQAVQELKALLQQSPDNTSGLLLLASLYEMNGNEKDARAYYMKAAETRTTAGVAAAAQYLWRTKDGDEALKLLTKSINRASGEPDLILLDLKAKILIANKQYKEALALFERIERRQPEIGFVYVVNTYLAMKDYPKALARVKREIAARPNAIGLRGELSRVQLISGNSKDATDTAREIIKGNPTSPVGYMALALVHQSNKEIDKAIDTLKGAAGKAKDQNLYLMLSNLYLGKRNYASALEQCNKAEALKPGQEQIVFQKAVILHGMGRKKEAQAEYERVLRASPGNVGALNNLAYLLAEENKSLPQAQVYAMRAFALAPHNDLVADTLGYLLVKNGRVDEGLKMLNKVSESRPNDPNIQYHLGLAYRASGKTTLAVKCLEKCLSLGDFPEAREAKLLLETIKKNGAS